MLGTYIDVILRLFSLGLVIAAGGLWAGAGVETRPKYRDDQTLVGGAIWSQTVIPIGLLISKIVNEHVDSFVHGYFLVAGITILCSTGMVLILGEYKAMNRNRGTETNSSNISALPVTESYDKIYFTIGILSLVAASFKLCELVTICFP